MYVDSPYSPCKVCGVCGWSGLVSVLGFDGVVVLLFCAVVFVLLFCAVVLCCVGIFSRFGRAYTCVCAHAFIYSGVCIVTLVWSGLVGRATRAALVLCGNVLDQLGEFPLGE